MRPLRAAILGIVLLLAPSTGFAQLGSTAATDATKAGRQPYHDPTAVALRSVLVPGWGQRVLGRPERATPFFVGALVSLPVALRVVGVPLLDDSGFEQAIGVGMYVFVVALASVDAFQVAERLNVENGYELESSLPPPPRSAIRITLLQRRF